MSAWEGSIDALYYGNRMSGKDMKKQFLDKQHIEYIFSMLASYKDALEDYPSALRSCHLKSHKFFNEHMFDIFLHPEQEIKNDALLWKHKRLIGRCPAPGMADLNDVLKCFPELNLKDRFEIRYIVVADEIVPAVTPFIVPQDADEKAIDYVRIESTSWID